MAGVGAPLATAFVRIRPDDTGFGRELKRQMESAAAPASKAVNQALIVKLGDQIQESNRRIARSELDARAAEIGLAAARAKLTAVTQDANATDEDRTKAVLAVDKANQRHADSLAAVGKAQRDARGASEKLRRALSEQADQTRRTDDDTHRFGQTLRNELGRGLNLRQFNTLAQKIRDIRTIASATISPIKDFSAQIGRLAVTAGAASTALVAGVGLSAGLLALAGALAQVAGAAPLAATGILGLVGVMATVKAATSGVGGAFGEVISANEKLAVGAKMSKADLAKLSESLKKLAPNARDTVLEFNRLYPSLRRVQQAVQQRFFAGFSRDVRALAERFLPTLSKAGEGLAVVLNQTVRGAVRNLLNSTTEWNLASVLAVARRSVQAVSRPLQQMPRLFVDIAAAAGPAFERVARGVGGVLTRIVAGIEGAINSGALTRGIDNAIASIKNLGSIVGNVFSVIHSLVTAATGQIGGDLLGAIAAVTGKLAGFLKSAPIRDGLRNVFAGAAPILHDFADLVVSAAGQLAGLWPVILDLARAFVDALAPVIPVAADLAGAIGGALADVLPAVSELAVALGQSLTGAVKELAPVVKPLAHAVAGLLSPLGIFNSLVHALAPVLVILADGLADVLGALAGAFVSVIDHLADTLPPLATALATIARIVASSLAGALQSIAPKLPGIVDGFTGLLNAVIPLLPGVLAVVGPLLQLAVAVLPPLIALLTLAGPPILFMSTLLLRLNAAVLILAGAVLGPLLRALTWLYTFFTTALRAAGDWADRILRIIGATIAGIVGWFAGLPGRTLAALVGWATGLGRAAAGALGALVGAITTGVTTAVGWVRGLPGRAVTALAGFATRMASAGAGAIGALAQGVRQGAGAVIQFFAQLPGQIVDFVQALPGRLYAAGKQMIFSLAQGILDAAFVAVNAAKSVAGRIAGLLPGSPVREGPLQVLNNGYAGRQIVRMLAGGIDAAGPIDLSRTLARIPGQLAAGGQAGAFGQPALAAAGGGGPVHVTGEFRLRGTDLVAVVDRVGSDRARR